MGKIHWSSKELNGMIVASPFNRIITCFGASVLSDIEQVRLFFRWNSVENC